MTRFDFAFDPRFRPLLLFWGATPDRAEVLVEEERLRARFGFYHLDTERSNVAGATVEDGPFNPVKAIGVRLSLADRSVTFGSAVERMARVAFHRPVRVGPVDVVSHPELWVSVADPEGLVAELSRPSGG